MLYDPCEFAPYDASQEAIFPPELMVSTVLANHSYVFSLQTLFDSATANSNCNCVILSYWNPICNK